MPIFLREHGAASYRVDTYFLGRTMAELPFQVIYPTIYGTIIYWLVGKSPNILYSSTILIINMI
jgi:ABC-2 type transporter